MPSKISFETIANFKILIPLYTDNKEILPVMINPKILSLETCLIPNSFKLFFTNSIFSSKLGTFFIGFCQVMGI